MANNPNNPLGNAGAVVGVAAGIAGGQSVSQALKEQIKNASLDALLGPTSLFAGGLLGALKVMKSIVEQSGILERGLKNIANLQNITGKFETLLKSAEAANKRIQELYRFAANSPFKFEQVAEANRVLETLTKGALSGARGMKLVGDSAAATGEDITYTAEKFGKLYSALASGRGIDRVLFQLQASGAVTDELAASLEQAQAMGKNFAETWAIVEKALGATAGGMAKQSRDLGTLNKQLAEAGSEMERAFGTAFVDAQTKAIETSIAATKNLTPVLKQIGQDIAPLLTLFGAVKNEITLSVVSMRGFSDALMIAWTVAKGLFVALSAATLASLAAGLQTAGTTALSFVGALRASFVAARATAAAQAALASATALSTAATEAMTAGNLLSAASLKLQSLWVGLSARAAVLHAAAMTTAGAGTARFSLFTYAAAMATGTLTGALKLAWTALTVLSRGLVATLSTLVTNPVTAIALAAGAASVAFNAWADSVNRVNEAFIETVNNATRLREEVRKSVASVKTLDDWRVSAALLAERLKDVRATMSGLEGKNDENSLVAMAEARRNEAEILRQKKILDGKLATTGLGKDEKARIVADADQRLQLQDAERRAVADRGDDATRLKFLREEAVRLKREADIGRAQAVAQDAPERLGRRVTALSILNDRIAKQEAQGKIPNAEDYARQAELAKFASTAGEKEVALVAAETEILALETKLKLKKEELGYDMQIAAVRARGGQTATLEAQKQLTLLGLQLKLAEAQGRTQDAKEIGAQIAATKAEQSQFRINAALERARTAFGLRGDSRGAQAFSDLAERQKLRDQYTANGLTTAQADSDFAARMRLQSGPPRIVADSLQSVGGGGGVYGGSPIEASLKRQEAMNALQTSYLKIIADAAGSGRGIKG